MADVPRHGRGSHFSGRPSAQPSAGSGSARSPYGQVGRHASGRAASGPSPRSSAGPASHPGTGRVAPRRSPHAAPRAAGTSRGRSAVSMQSLATPRTRAQRASASRGGHSGRGPILGAVAGVAILVILAVLLVPRLLAGTAADQASLPNQGTQVEVSIADGSGANAVASALKGAGLLADTGDFVTEVQKQRAESSLKSGAYVFTVGQSIDDIIAQLESGPNSTSGRLTIPEGLTLTKTAATVEQVLGIPASDFEAQAKASNYVQDYPFLADAAASSYDSLEGYLCPKTYDFSGRSDVTADAVIRAMLDQYAKDVASLDFKGAEATIKERYGVDVSDYDLLKLASIVEREAVTDEQRPKISSTFFNRLKQGMPLQSDATYMYVTGGEVTYEQLQADPDNPYNTRYHTGLTPTPICAPSVDSVKATLAPAETDYLYFYITPETEAFSSTYDEHLAAQTQG